MSIKTKISLIMALSVVLILATIILTGLYAKSREEKALRELVGITAKVAATGSLDALRKGNMSSFESILKEMAAQKHIKEFSLSDAEGRIKYSSNKALVGKTYKELIGKAKEGQLSFLTGNSFIELIPVRTTSYCLRCHSNWRLGEVNSYFIIKYDASVLAAFSRVRALQIGLVVVIGLVMLVIGIFVLNVTIGKSLEEFKRGVETIASGDFSVRFHEGPDEMGQMGALLNRLVERLTKQILDVSEAAEKVAFSTQNIVSSADVIEEAATQQLEETEGIASATDEIAVAAEDIALRTDKVKQAVDDMHHVVENGQGIIDEVSSGMESLISTIEEIAKTTQRLGESSAQIREIVDVINEIAEQTNLLALNAAIEAARAGEHGRGFAVVADEVRKLAERTQKSTDDIRKIIDTILSEIDAGVQVINKGVDEARKGRNIVDEIKNFFTKVKSDVEGITDQMSQVAAAVEEQSSITKEMAKRTEGIAEAAKKNLEEVSRMKELSKQLSTLVEKLQKIVDDIKAAFKKAA